MFWLDRCTIRHCLDKVLQEAEYFEAILALIRCEVTRVAAETSGRLSPSVYIIETQRRPNQ